jgi:hypothetical protein
MGAPFDAERYAATIEASCLEMDLEVGRARDLGAIWGRSGGDLAAIGGVR